MTKLKFQIEIEVTEARAASPYRVGIEIQKAIEINTEWEVEVTQIETAEEAA
jgi:hypothetical protein